MNDLFFEKRTRISYILLMLFFGIVLGTFSKFIEALTMDSGSSLSSFIGILSLVLSSLGIWVFLATLIVNKSQTIVEACFGTMVFFIGLVISYYIYTTILFGFFPKDIFIFWLIISLLTIIPAFILALPKHIFGLYYIIQGIPIAFLLYLGYSFYYTFKPLDLIHLILAFILLIGNIVDTDTRNRIELFISSAVFFVLFYFLLPFVGIL